MDVSGAGIVYLLAMDAHAGGKLCLADVIFATVVSSNTVQKILGIFINIKRLATAKINRSSCLLIGHVSHLHLRIWKQSFFWY